MSIPCTVLCGRVLPQVPHHRFLAKERPPPLRLGQPLGTTQSSSHLTAAPVCLPPLMGSAESKLGSSSALLAPGEFFLLRREWGGEKCAAMVVLFTILGERFIFPAFLPGFPFFILSPFFHFLISAAHLFSFWLLTRMCCPPTRRGTPWPRFTPEVRRRYVSSWLSALRPCAEAAGFPTAAFSVTYGSEGAPVGPGHVCSLGPIHQPHGEGTTIIIIIIIITHLSFIFINL